MNLEKLKQHAADLGVISNVEQLIGGGLRLYISLERISNGKAHLISAKETIPLMRYLKQVKAKWDYVGNYTGISVLLPNEGSPVEGG
jgi:hypothetical protein